MNLTTFIKSLNTKSLLTLYNELTKKPTSKFNFHVPTGAGNE